MINSNTLITLEKSPHLIFVPKIPPFFRARTPEMRDLESKARQISAAVFGGHVPTILFASEAALEARGHARIDAYYDKPNDRIVIHEKVMAYSLKVRYSLLVHELRHRAEYRFHVKPIDKDRIFGIFQDLLTDREVFLIQAELALYFNDKKMDLGEKGSEEFEKNRYTSELDARVIQTIAEFVLFDGEYTHAQQDEILRQLILLDNNQLTDGPNEFLRQLTVKRQPKMVKEDVIITNKPELSYLRQEVLAYLLAFKVPEMI